MRVLTQLSGLFVGCKPCQIDLSFSEKKADEILCRKRFLKENKWESHIKVRSLRKDF